MDLTIEPVLDISDKDVDAHTVHVDGNRILTMVTDSEQLLNKWLKDAKKITNNTKISNTTVVTLTAVNVRPTDDSQYHQLVLSLGTSCFMHQVLGCCKDYWGRMPNRSPKLLREFLEIPRVTVVGVGINVVAKKLDRVQGIKIANAVDLRDLAKGRGVLDTDLSGLCMSVLGKSKPEKKKKLRWFVAGREYGTFVAEKVMYATAESYITFQIAATLIATTENEGKM